MDGRTDTRSFAERLKGKFQRKGEDECWPWIAASDPLGYGRITVEQRTKLATHIILIADNRPRPLAPNDHALHKVGCLPSCSNPKHLRWGNHKDNMQDKIKAGTSKGHGMGAARRKSNLTNQDVLDIRASTLTLNNLAKLYKISSRSIWDIKKRRSWSHI